ncbi:hypothetical protein GDO78_001172 [Eleutherodactylus coqui]|uniref:Uncharacterized protein n=1 Tax=Eleutherodactylus coqui TaxID=57060 RepID=A0A8J6FS27_ELECQ|nr:hypothetical protein GDO78_001172 [Eleutherodactylus coqui]
MAHTTRIFLCQTELACQSGDKILASTSASLKDSHMTLAIMSCPFLVGTILEKLGWPIFQSVYPVLSHSKWQHPLYISNRHLQV